MSHEYISEWENEPSYYPAYHVAEYAREVLMRRPDVEQQADGSYKDSWYLQDGTHVIMSADSFQRDETITVEVNDGTKLERTLYELNVLRHSVKMYEPIDGETWRPILSRRNNLDVCARVLVCLQGSGVDEPEARPSRDDVFWETVLRVWHDNKREEHMPSVYESVQEAAFNERHDTKTLRERRDELVTTIWEQSGTELFDKCDVDHVIGKIAARMATERRHARRAAHEAAPDDTDTI